MPIVHGCRDSTRVGYAGIVKPDSIRDAGLRELGAEDRLNQITYDEVGDRRSYEDRVRLFDEYKVELKKEHRAMALECHPDRTGDRPEAERTEKEERFKRVTRAFEWLMKISIRESVPPQPRLTPRWKVTIVQFVPIMVVDMGTNERFRPPWREETTANSSTCSTYWPWND